MIKRAQSGLQKKGFTVAEMLVALMVASIVFAAVGTLALAVGNAQESTEEMNESQAKLRCATLRVAEYIRYARLVVWIPTNGVAVWRADDNDDAQINGSELVYIESLNAGGVEQLRILEFPDQSQVVTIGEIASGAARTTLIDAGNERVTVLVEPCSNVTFTNAAPTAGFVNLMFDITEGTAATTYQISARVNGSADNLIGPGGELTGGDDD